MFHCIYTGIFFKHLLELYWIVLMYFLMVNAVLVTKVSNI